jgi:polyisoprenoid-binding protein YceI
MLSIIFSSAIAFAAPQDYAFLSNKGVLFVQVFKADTLASAASHDHAIQAIGWSGKANWDHEDYSTCTVSISVPVNNLQVDNPNIRTLAKLEGTLSDSMRKDVKKHMLSDVQLDAEKYPLISFKSTSCSKPENGQMLTNMKGNFTMHGKTNPVSVNVTVSETDGLQLKGSFPIKATDYGITPYSAMFGAVGNKDEMTITFDLQAAQ